MRDATAAREYFSKLAKISREDPWELAQLASSLMFVGLHEEALELARILEQQSIDRPFISGPPYRCEGMEAID